MSNKSLQQALANLLPTHAEALPPELVNHASNLLAQSRSYGSSLRPEEEIARPYVCAEIACKRLSKSLKLPPLLGRPPCPPRVYKKTYTYLEQALLKSSTTASRTTPRKPTGTSTSLRTPSKNSPAVTANGSPLKRPLPMSPFRKTANNRRKAPLQSSVGINSVSNKKSIQDAPSWTMPLIRRVCKALSTRTPSSTSYSRPTISLLLPPHIFVGVSSILSFISEPGEQWDETLAEFLAPLSVKTTTQIRNPDSQDTKIYRDRISTLIVAVYFVVLARRRPSSSAETLDVDTYIEMASAALESLGLEGTSYVSDVDDWLSIIMLRNWTVGTEWFENIPGPAVGNEDEVENVDDEKNDGDKDIIVGLKRKRALRMESRRRSRDGMEKPRGGLQPGLGTMMQDRLNWLSEDKRGDYLEWKAGIMGRIRAIESGMVVG
ncbi:uncharacterized protein PADG_05003 [Paracoccidioides brasiliensis Pb18]|uniref:ORC6 first cyclin-like domain-containing protein n=1 Tax=Paracoccidioides brasiliensis (strain Pb18) TaxID=502780 RepID=C1GBK2_PARBD|nr:uncharacterized protein PADG_05003 [Paracoccidioides brasiliensis Pb18]EEH48924.2 hypothetical protein PADG_05003 [Paracoccidioides brasiliensis Pb18]